MAQVILCNIATELDKAKITAEGNEKNLYVVYNSRYWTPLKFISVQNLSRLISNIHNFYTRTLNLVSYLDDDDETYMAVTCYQNSLYLLNVCLPNAFGDIFHLLFKNYDPQRPLSVYHFNRDSPDVMQNENRIGTITTKFYDALYAKHCKSLEIQAAVDESQTFQLPYCFQPKLCNYQVRSVKWLLKRECEKTQLPSFFTRLEARDEQNVVYKHNYCSYFQETAPDYEFIDLAPGGILADEMGLGKTVEMLALLLLHPRGKLSPFTFDYRNEKMEKNSNKTKTLFCICHSKVMKNLIQCTKCKLWQHEQCISRHNSKHMKEINEPYFCPSCWKKMTEKNLLETGATFIVSPNTIKSQWLSEIKRHIEPNLRVLIYEGVRHGNWISPRQLADYDIVLTDYFVLRGDIYHTSENETDRCMRHKPRTMRVNSPLLMLNWWRVCLDEAQVVESSISNVSVMVRLLPAVNRWAVTGTPIQRSIEDLYSLLEFIGFKEILQPSIIWKHLTQNFIRTKINANYTPALVDILHHCMWRTCKSHVIKELQLPPQSEVIHRIQLSNLEWLFYAEQHAIYETDFMMKQNFTDRTNKMLLSNAQAMKIILFPFIKIRQCCTISVVSLARQNNVPVEQKQFLNPKELHKHLKAENEQECKSLLRTIASSHNGMAGIYFLRKDYDDCIKNYSAVLKLAQQHNKGNITVDSLLQIHALQNMVEAYSAMGITSTEMIQKYEKDCQALEWKYLEPYAVQMKKTKAAFEVAHEKIPQELDFLDCLHLVLNTVTEDDALHEALIQKVRDECSLLFGSNQKLSELRSIGAFKFLICSWYKKCTQLLNYLMIDLESLRFYTENIKPRNEMELKTWLDIMTFVRSVYDCHLSEIRNVNIQNNDTEYKPQKKKRKKNCCKLCKIESDLNNLECMLFNKTVNERTNTNEGADHPSLEIYMLKLMFNFVKLKPKFKIFFTKIENQMEATEALQTMCKKLLKYWIEIEYTVKAHDELDMCKMRISLAENEEDVKTFEILPWQMPDMLVEQSTNLQTAQLNFVKKQARLKYIMHLEENTDPVQCPICQMDDVLQYAVLECGHHMCFPCIRVLNKYSQGSNFSCSICRNQQSLNKIYLVTRDAKESNLEEVQIIGDYSAKIKYMIRLIKKLKCENADENTLKILIFSEWTPILNAIAYALENNGISYCNSFTPKAIDQFKNLELGITCFLMPLQKGAKGLNLIEATHVFLVEPVLNPSDELQAIGRVHRFGQTKPTTVHRFIVNNTIEENIFDAVRAGTETEENWQFNLDSLDSISKLFKLHNDVTANLIND